MLSEAPIQDQSTQGYLSMLSEAPSQDQSTQGYLSRFLRKCSRKLPPENSALTSNKDIDDSEMVRCLTTLDLISLGTGTLAGCNLFVLPGLIYRQVGVAGVVSMAVVTLGSLSTGLHYAELSSVCPGSAGSIYLYAHIILGEWLAFSVGWSFFVECLIGACFTAVGLSNFVNYVSEGYIHHYTGQVMESIGLPRIDFVAALVCVTLTWIIASGIKLSSNVVKGLNVITFMILAVFISLSFCLGSSTTWKENEFAPFGLDMILASVPTCYYSTVGFDGVATLGTECKTPARSIPIAIVATIIMGTLFTGLSIVLINFDLPMNQVPLDTGILDLFSPQGYPFVKYIMAIGAFTSLLTNAFGFMFPLPRMTYAMAQDDLLFRYFAHICPKRRTPFRATIAFGVIGTLVAALADFKLLLELSLLGTVVCYVVAVGATMVLRYVGVDHNSYNSLSPSYGSTTSTHTPSASQEFSTSNSFQKTNNNNSMCAKYYVQTQTLALFYFKTFLVIIHAGIFVCCLFVSIWRHQLMEMRFMMVVFGVVLTLVVMLVLILISLPQASRQENVFRSPVIPYVSMITSALNIYTLTSLASITWLMYCVWMGVGACIYVTHGCQNVCRQSNSPPSNTHEEDVNGSTADNNKCADKKD